MQSLSRFERLVWTGKMRTSGMVRLVRVVIVMKIGLRRCLSSLSMVDRCRVLSRSSLARMRCRSMSSTMEPMNHQTWSSSRSHSLPELKAQALS